MSDPSVPAAPPPASAPVDPNHPVDRQLLVDRESSRARTYALWLGALMGVVYGVLLQLMARAPGIKDAVVLMTFGMVFLLPTAIGFIVVLIAGWRLPFPVSWLQALFSPWLAVAPCLLLSFAVGWEGAFCLIFATPIFLLFSSFGGVVGKGLLSARLRPTTGALVLLLVAATPLTSGFVENTLGTEDAVHYVRTEIAIAAPRAAIWPEIIRVRKITEPSPGLFYKLGFPKPIEATLSHEGVGGVRSASFERGLLFVETVTDWQPEERLSFRIQADARTAQLDPHVLVGGRYFDVLQGTYEIADGPGGTHILRLWSRFRMSTHFNFYAGLIGDALMRDIQNSILRVLKDRCEARASG